MKTGKQCPQRPALQTSPEGEIATLIPIQTPIATPEGEPTPVNSVKIVAVSANSNRNLAIDTQGRVWEWGTYETGPANSPCKRDGIDCKLLPSLVPGLDAGDGGIHRL